MQWHPIFAESLRALLQDFFQTNVPLGDAPREADIVLLQRTSDQPTRFRGLWRHLTTWNVLEFKGPSFAACLSDPSLLIELGLGIHRRLNVERRRQKLLHRMPEDACFWYVVGIMGRRVVARARQRFGHLEEIETGLWRSQVLQHLVFLIYSEAFASPTASRCICFCSARRSRNVSWAISSWRNPTFWSGMKRGLARCILKCGWR